MQFRHCLVIVVLFAIAKVAFAETLLSAEEGWVRWVPPVSANSAAYFTLHNETKTDAVLVAAESDVANAVELHTVVQKGDVMAMQPLEKLIVPAQDCVRFKPGSHHVMLIGLKKPLQEGQAVAMTLRFASGETLPLTLTVKSDGADDAHAHHH